MAKRKACAAKLEDQSASGSKYWARDKELISIAEATTDLVLTNKTGRRVEAAGVREFVPKDSWDVGLDGPFSQRNLLKRTLAKGL